MAAGVRGLRWEDGAHVVDLRNRETIVRVGGAPSRLSLAGTDHDNREIDKMSDRDMQIACTMLAVEGVLCKLDVLRLDDNDIGATGAAALAATLSAGT